MPTTLRLQVNSSLVVAVQGNACADPSGRMTSVRVVHDPPDSSTRNRTTSAVPGPATKR